MQMQQQAFLALEESCLRVSDVGGLRHETGVGIVHPPLQQPRRRHDASWRPGLESTPPSVPSMPQPAMAGRLFVPGVCVSEACTLHCQFPVCAAHSSLLTSADSPAAACAASQVRAVPWLQVCRHAAG